MDFTKPDQIRLPFLEFVRIRNESQKGHTNSKKRAYEFQKKGIRIPKRAYEFVDSFHINSTRIRVTMSINKKVHSVKKKPAFNGFKCFEI